MSIANLQVLRAVAATSVVGHHLIDYLHNYIDPAPGPRTFRTFAVGVDVFFVISGFIMAATALRRDDGAAQFMKARIMRVVPLYWLLTGCAALALAAGFQLFAWPGLSFGHLLSSLLFLPHVNQLTADTRPILYVGWSLNYEMCFYAIFAAALLTRTLRTRLTLVVLSLCALVMAGAFSDNRYLQYYGDPIVLEFAGGVGLYFLSRRRSLTVLAASLGTALSLLAIVGFDWLELEERVRPLVWGLPAGLLVWSVVSLETRGKRLQTRALQQQGDASYALYLSHPFVLQLVGKVSIVVGLCGTPLRNSCSVLLALTTALVVGTLTHERVEKPITAWLRSRVGVRQPVPVAT